MCVLCYISQTWNPTLSSHLSLTGDDGPQLYASKPRSLVAGFAGVPPSAKPMCHGGPDWILLLYDPLFSCFQSSDVRGVLLPDAGNSGVVSASRSSSSLTVGYGPPSSGTVASFQSSSPSPSSSSSSTSSSSGVFYSSGTPEKRPTRIRWLCCGHKSQQDASRHTETYIAGKAGRRITYIRQLGNDNRHDRQKVDDKVRQVVVRVVRGQQKQNNGHAEQELLGGRVLGTVVDLLPHVEVVVGAAVELKGHAPDVVEHDVRADHVRDVGQRP